MSPSPARRQSLGQLAARDVFALWPRIVIAVAVVGVLLALRLAFAGEDEAPLAAEARPQIRVLLGCDAPSLRISAEDLRSEAAAQLELGSAIEVRTQSRGLLVLGADGRAWIHDTGEDSKAPLILSWTGPARIEADGLRRDDDLRHFGSLSVTTDKASLRSVLHTDLELYTMGVLDAEMGASFPPAALEAQAITARSFALSARDRRTELVFDVFDDERDQVYRGVREHPRFLKAVRATQHQVLQHDGKRLRTYYSSTCGGATRDGFERFRDVPKAPFRSVTCKGCTDSPRYRWSRSIERSAFAALGVSASGRLEVRALTRSPRGDWLRMRVTDGSRTREHAAKRLHALRPLPSLWLDGVTRRGDEVVVRGRGFGHGVGLCQYGARGYAREGMDARQILAHYFPGAEIAPLANFEAKTGQ